MATLVGGGTMAIELSNSTSGVMSPEDISLVQDVKPDWVSLQDLMSTFQSFSGHKLSSHSQRRRWASKYLTLFADVGRQFVRRPIGKACLRIVEEC